MAEGTRVIDRDPRPEKVSEVEDITQRFREAEAALLTEYRGLRVGDLAELRTSLREVDTSYKVLKNTLARIAAREAGMEELVGMLEGPTAIAFIRGDAVAAAKALDDAVRKYPVLVVKGGILKGRILSADQARALASVEPREVQLTKIAMLSNTPLQQTVNVFAAVLRDLGSVLAQVVSKKESGELPAGTAAANGAPAATDGAESAPSAEAETTDDAEAPATAEGAETTEAAGGTPGTEATAEGTEGPEETEGADAAATAEGAEASGAAAAEGGEAAPGPAEGNGDPGAGTAPEGADAG